MRTLPFLILLSALSIHFNGFSQVIWSENFDSYSDGTTVGGNNNTANPAADWTIDCPGCNSGRIFEKSTVLGFDVFQATNLDAPGTWTSETIDISGTGLAVVELNTGTLSDNDGDYLRAYYYLDGGARQLFYEVNGGLALDEPATVILQGSTIVIEVEMFNNDEVRGFFGTLLYDYYTLEDITVTAITNLYSRASADFYTTGTWSAAGYGGADCGCTPTTNNIVNIGAGFSVTTASDATVAAAVVETGGVLNVNGAYNFNIQYGSTLTVGAGSSITTSNSASSLNLLSESTYTLDIDGALTIGNLTSGDNQIVDILGSGTLNIQTDLILNSNVQMTNSLSSMNIGSQMEFSASSDVTVFQNDGTVTVASNIFFDNDDSGIINNGTFTSTGNIDVNSGGFFGDDNNFITNNGTFSFANVEVNNRSFTLTNNSTINQSGSFTNGQIDTDFDAINSAGAVWNYEGASYDASMDTQLDADASGNSFNYSANGNQTVIATTYFDVSFQGSGTKTTNGNLDVNGSLSIEGSAALNVNAGDDNITLAGNWDVTSSSGNPFVEGTETVTFDGTGVQTITHPGTETFYNLTINKGSGSVDMNSAVDVAGTLNLSNGLVYPNSNDLTVTATGAVSNGNSGSYVVTDGSGTLIQEDLGSGGRTGDVLFPVGSQPADYTPLTINNTSGTADDFSVNVINNVYENGGTSGIQLTTAIVFKTWFINEATAGGSNANLTFQWNGSNEAVDFDPADVLVSRHNGMLWDPVAEGLAAAGGDPFTVTASGVTNFSPFAVGSSESALPVELVSFTAVLNDGAVDIAWETASELNNDFFTVEKTIDLLEFEIVDTIDGKGTTTESNTYKTLDRRPYNGVSYYRLRQTDFDGTTTYSDPVRVENLLQQVTLNLFPVPGNGEYLNMQIQGLSADITTDIQIIDMLGNVVYHEKVEIDHIQGLYKHIELNLSSGVYTFMLNLPDPMIRQFVVK